MNPFAQSHRSFSPTRPVQPGTVYLVGAGPGDPELITVRGCRCLERADVVLYDRLVHPALLDQAPAEANRTFVGKAAGRPGLGQAAIHRLLIAHARRGLVVIRLKGGDPFIFGRGSEEAEALNAAGIPWEVVPAVSSAVGVPARAGIPLTHRRLARSFAVVTAHQADASDLDWQALSKIETLVVLMGVAALNKVTRRLIRQGRDPRTPAAIISRGTLPDQRVVIGTLADLATRAETALIKSPATIVIGDVVALREQLMGPMTDTPETGRAERPPTATEIHPGTLISHLSLDPSGEHEGA